MQSSNQNYKTSKHQTQITYLAVGTNNSSAVGTNNSSLKTRIIKMFIVSRLAAEQITKTLS